MTSKAYNCRNNLTLISSLNNILHSEIKYNVSISCLLFYCRSKHKPETLTELPILIHMEKFVSIPKIIGALRILVKVSARLHKPRTRRGWLQWQLERGGWEERNQNRQHLNGGCWTRSQGEVYLGLSDLDLALALIVTFVCHPHIFISVISPLPSPMRGLDGFVFSLGWMLFQNKPFMVLGCCWTRCPLSCLWWA